MRHRGVGKHWREPRSGRRHWRQLCPRRTGPGLRRRGARSVVASHWPVPESFDATKRLISGLLSAKAGEPLAMALGEAQRGLMDDPRTSHPVYWAAFIILGDGAKPLVPLRQAGASREERIVRPGH
nr:CHAT domain-containing protein [Sphingomonas rhizophila]